MQVKYYISISIGISCLVELGMILNIISLVSWAGL